MELHAVSIQAVAEQLAISTRTVARLIANGDLPSVKIGRRRLIRVEALRAWLAGREAV